MSFKQFSRHQAIAESATPYDLSQLQDRLEEVLEQLTSKDQLDTLLFEDVALVAGQENWLEHGLGATVRGWRVNDLDQPAIINRVSGSTADLTKYLPLATTVTCNVSIEVYA